jgi:hypothetical protein
MEALVHLGNGFLQVLQPANLLVLFIGLVLGMLVAVLPGLTLVMGVVLALPFTYTMELLPAAPSPPSCSAFRANRSTFPCCGTATPWRARASRPRPWAGRCSRHWAAAW